jgi:hypothetical protein
MKRIVYFFLLSLVFLSLISPVYAAKKRIRAPKIAGVSYSAAKLSRNTNSVIVTFLNLGRAKREEYSLSYMANGIQQGVVGSFVPTGQATESRDLYFGTCSKGVCTPHYGITNASLTVTTTLKNGSSYIKRYRFKGL